MNFIDSIDMKAELHNALSALNITATAHQCEQWLTYLEQLNKWNKTYNLTAIRNPEDMFSHHLLDSLAIAPEIIGNTVLDVGTGAGLPGVPLAILFPEKSFTLVDSNGKKTRFIQHVKRLMELDNVSVFNGRVEKLSTETMFDVITSRAFADLSLMVKLTRHVLADKGKMVAMKGPKAQHELEQLNEEVHDLSHRVYTVPNIEGERHLLTFSLTSP